MLFFSSIALPNLFLYSFLALSSSVLWTLLYRYYFHPLSKHPGPLLGKLTDWYSIYHGFKGDRHVNLYNLHQKYGPKVRFGPNRVSINTSDALSGIYGAKANTSKGQYYAVFGHFFEVQSTLTTINKKEHDIKRRILSQALSPTAIKSMESGILKNIRTLCAILQNKDTETTSSSGNDCTSNTRSRMLEMSSICSRLTFDLMGGICFNYDFMTLTKVTNRHILDVLPDGIKCLNIVGHMPELLKLRIHKIFMPKLVQDMEDYKEFSRDLTEKRLSQDQSAEKNKDAFSYLLHAKDLETGTQFTMEELISEASLLLIAGSDTTASAMYTTLYYLLSHPQKLEILRDEILKRFKAVEDIRSGPELYACVYLKACLDESLRMSPGVPGLLPREVLKGGVTVGEDFFPAGTVLGTPCYAIHHNESYYPSPFTYEPERWIVGEKWSAEDVAKARSAFCPFGIGPWSCVGKHMAITETSIVIARIVFLFEMRISAVRKQDRVGEAKFLEMMRKRGEIASLDKFVAKHEGSLVEFRLRDDVPSILATE